METNDEWHLDKRVPISLIITIIIQTAAIVWFISSLNERVSVVESRTIELQDESRLRQQTSATNSTAIAVINQNLIEIHRSLKRIEDGLASDRTD